MDRVMLNPMQQMAYQPSWPMDQSFYMNYPPEYPDIYYFKMMRMNSTTYAAD